LTRSCCVMSLASVRRRGGPLSGGLMRRRARSILAVGTLLLGGAGFAPVAQAQPAPPSSGDPGEVKVYRADVTRQQVPLLLAAGQDGH
jgi:hypothetical protein